jgi:predicted nucleotidyltransferase component of viral defense system
MITKAELVAIAKKEKLPLGTIEKDFVITYMLKRIYESELKNSLLFKGGTALHKLYFHKRFSVDLDFTLLQHIDPVDVKGVLEGGVIKSRVKALHEIGSSTRITLGYISVLDFANRIFLDIRKGEKPLLPPIWQTIQSPFFHDFAVLTFRLEELLAEKLRVLMQRKKPRDYLDLYFSAEYGKVDFDKTVSLAKKKLSSFREEFDKKKIFEGIELVQHLWEQDLREIMPSVPDFNTVLNRIKNVFNL